MQGIYTQHSLKQKIPAACKYLWSLLNSCQFSFITGKGKAGGRVYYSFCLLLVPQSILVGKLAFFLRNFCYKAKLLSERGGWDLNGTITECRKKFSGQLTTRWQRRKRYHPFPCHLLLWLLQQNKDPGTDFYLLSSLTNPCPCQREKMR